MDFNFDMVGPALALGLSSIGSSIGCGIAGMASHAVMSRVEEGHGKFIGMAAAPSSQSIYGFILMLLMSRAIKAGTLAPLSGIGIGAVAGLAIMLSAIYQGMAAATGIQASAKQPAILGNVLQPWGLLSRLRYSHSFFFAPSVNARHAELILCVLLLSGVFLP